MKAIYEREDRTVVSRLLYRCEEASLEVEPDSRLWPFDDDGALFRLVSEEMRIRLAHLFDPYLAIHTSRSEPLSHQITAVYSEILKRQPLRILLTGCPTALFSVSVRLCS